MKYTVIVLLSFLISSCNSKPAVTTDYFNHVDQVLWVVKNLDNAVSHWKNLGFDQVLILDTVTARLRYTGKSVRLKLAKANLGGANITWIQPLEEGSMFSEFHQSYGDGAMSLVHRMVNKKALKEELKRLSAYGLKIKEEMWISTREGDLNYLIMDTWNEGKYYLGFTYGGQDIAMMLKLKPDNLHSMKINQYAFAIRDPGPVSAFWHKIGQPEFQMNDPVLGHTHYYGEIVDHTLIQGWQREFDVAYEWCIPVKPPIVYDDHIKKHGEGIHHLAFTVKDMDKVLQDYAAKGFVVSMGGTWGEKGKPGSGRYEYIDMENGGGLTMELLWSLE